MTSTLRLFEAPRSIPLSAHSINSGKNKIPLGGTEDGLKLRDKIEEILLKKTTRRPSIDVNSGGGEKIEKDSSTLLQTLSEMEEGEKDSESEDEETQPFTVVRVSSSVSQVSNCE